MSSCVTPVLATIVLRPPKKAIVFRGVISLSIRHEVGSRRTIAVHEVKMFEMSKLRWANVSHFVYNRPQSQDAMSDDFPLRWYHEKQFKIVRRHWTRR